MKNYLFEHKLAVSFGKSWLNIIEREPFFNPEKNHKNEFKDCLIGRFGQFTELGREVFEEITSEREELSLFEALLLIGWKVSNNPGRMAIKWQILVNAIANQELDPINPTTNLRHSKDFPSVSILGNTKAVIGDIPDFYWLIPFDELINFAALKWGEEPFAGLIDEEEFHKFKARIAKVNETESSQSSNELKPAYLDENHPMFSRELSIAIEAWDHVLSSNPPKPNRDSRKSLIYEWLEKHHRDLSTSAKDRIAGMLNPDKNGGAPPTN